MIDLTPISLNSRAASSPAGPPPMIRTLSAIHLPPGLCNTRLQTGLCQLNANVVPFQIFLFAALEHLQALLKFAPCLLVVYAHLFQQRPILGRVPVKLANLVRMRAHRHLTLLLDSTADS